MTWGRITGLDSPPIQNTDITSATIQYIIMHVNITPDQLETQPGYLQRGNDVGKDYRIRLLTNTESRHYQ